jgi:hypothetical protein
MGGGKFPWYLFYIFLSMKFGKAACGFVETSVFGDHDTPHWRLTNAKFDNKLLTKKGQNKSRGSAHADNHGNKLGFASA